MTLFKIQVMDIRLSELQVTSMCLQFADANIYRASYPRLRFSFIIGIIFTIIHLCVLGTLLKLTILKSPAHANRRARQTNARPSVFLKVFTKSVKTVRMKTITKPVVSC